MDDKRELNDILIGGDDVKTSSTKKLILLVVAIIVLIIAIVAIASVLFGSNEEEIVVNDINNANNSVQEAPVPFEAPPADNDADQFEKIVQEIRARQNASSQTTIPVPSAPIISEPSTEATEKIKMPSKTPEPATRITSQPKPKSKPATSNVVSYNRTNNGDIAENGYYLQVGAFTRQPNRDFLDSIDKYSYRTQEIMVNSKVITRYLVGPYNSRNAAQRDVKAVSRDITTPVLVEIK